MGKHRLQLPIRLERRVAIFGEVDTGPYESASGPDQGLALGDFVLPEVSAEGTNGSIQ